MNISHRCRRDDYFSDARDGFEGEKRERTILVLLRVFLAVKDRYRTDNERDCSGNERGGGWQ